LDVVPIYRLGDYAQVRTTGVHLITVFMVDLETLRNPPNHGLVQFNIPTITSDHRVTASSAYPNATVLDEMTVSVVDE
jgi:hypothetical protein